MQKLTTAISKFYSAPLFKTLNMFSSAIESLEAQRASASHKCKMRKLKEEDARAVKELIQKILLERGGIGIGSLYYDKELDYIFDIYKSKNHLFKSRLLRFRRPPLRR